MAKIKIVDNTKNQWECEITITLHYWQKCIIKLGKHLAICYKVHLAYNKTKALLSTYSRERIYIQRLAYEFL